MTEDRLSRIEKKLDDVAEAIVGLARMEERMITLFNRMDTYDKAQHKIADRLTEVEKLVAKKVTTVGIGEKATWLVVGACVSYVVAMMNGAAV